MVRHSRSKIDYNFVSTRAGVHVTKSDHPVQVEDAFLRNNKKTRPKEGLSLHWVSPSSTEYQYDYQAALEPIKGSDNVYDCKPYLSCEGISYKVLRAGSPARRTFQSLT